MGSTYRDRAIVLRKLDYGEADRIYTLLTAEHGKVGAIAKGVRKTTSRLAALEVFAEVDVLLARGRSLDIVTQVERMPAPRLGAEVERTAHAGLVVEVADRVTGDRHPMEGVYELTAGALRGLALEADVRRASAWFVGVALDLLGYGLLLAFCVSCERPLEPKPAPFTAAGGGFLCPRCRLPGMVEVSLPAIKVLRVIMAGDVDLYARLKLVPTLLEEVETVLETQLEHHLEGPLRSLQFIRQMRDHSVSRP